MPPALQTPTRDSSFASTRWTVVRQAADSQTASQHALSALSELCQIYWRPVYVFLRRQGIAQHDAQDLTQGFFAELLERDLLSRFDSSKSRLRTYLRVCADSFALNEIKAASRKKRGGEITHVALDFSAAEDELRAQTVDPAKIPSPESLEEFFEKEWIRSLFSSAVDELKSLCEARGKQKAFVLFESYDLDGEENISYAGLAARLEISATDVNNQIAWARREFRRIATERLHALCGSEEEFVRESQALFGESHK